MNTLTSKLTALVGLTTLGLFAARTAAATIVNSNFKANVTRETGIGEGSASPVDITITIINTFLSLLGIIALVLIIYAGFRWMTAGGKEEQITEAKGMLKAAVIGIAIVLLSYTIAQFIFSNLESATGQGAIS